MHNVLILYRFKFFIFYQKWSDYLLIFWILFQVILNICLFLYNCASLNDFLYFYTYYSNDAMDNSVYSSGSGTNYDPVRDTIEPSSTGGSGGSGGSGGPGGPGDVSSQGGNPQGGNPQNIQATPTHTEELASYLREKHARGALQLSETPVNFVRTSEMNSQADRLSLIARCVREHHPDFFSNNPRKTYLNPLIVHLNSIRENYPQVP